MLGNFTSHFLSLALSFAIQIQFVKHVRKSSYLIVWHALLFANPSTVVNYCCSLIVIELFFTYYIVTLYIV